MFIFNSCEEGSSPIGAEILPKDDFVAIGSIEDKNISSYTYYDNSVRSDNQSNSFLGTIYDPYFGLTTAGFVTQLRLQMPWDPDINAFAIDSVRLKLYLLDVKGDYDGVNYLRLSEIDEQLNIDSIYYSNKQVPLNGYVVPDIKLPKLKADSANYIEVEVSEEFGYHLLSDTSKLFHDNSRPDFRSYFKGLKFSLISEGDPLFLTLSLAPPDYLGGHVNYFTLYMTDGSGIPFEYQFILDAKSKNARFNTYSHDFTVASPEKRIMHIGDGVKDNLSYIQGLNGVFTRILLPELERIKKDPLMKDIAVNKARLIVPVYSDGDKYKASTMPTQLFLRYTTSTGEKYLVPDYNPNNTFFDGKIDTVAMVYKFNIATFAQGYLEDTKDIIKPELEVILSSGNTKNVILNANSTTTPIKFEFTYTKY
jgi:hypothetical protein